MIDREEQERRDEALHDYATERYYRAVSHEMFYDIACDQVEKTKGQSVAHLRRDYVGNTERARNYWTHYELRHTGAQTPLGVGAERAGARLHPVEAKARLDDLQATMRPGRPDPDPDCARRQAYVALKTFANLVELVSPPAEADAYQGPAHHVSDRTSVAGLSGFRALGVVKAEQTKYLADYILARLRDRYDQRGIVRPDNWQDIKANANLIVNEAAAIIGSGALDQLGLTETARALVGLLQAAVGPGYR
jgi:hypothetical protein